MRINNSHNLITMENEFVTYTQALALKELGFDKPCFRYIYTGDTGNNIDRYEEVEPSRAINYNHDSLCISQPLKQQVFRWFREKYGYWSYIKEATKGTCRFNIEKFDEKFFNSGLFGSYEDAESACIDKLIEMVKKK